MAFTTGDGGVSGSPGNGPSMNPMLLASACLGSTTGLLTLLEREDNQEQLMMVSTQAFLEMLPGYTPGRFTRRSRMVPQASDDLEAGVDQPTPVAAEGGADRPAAQPPAAPDNAQDGITEVPALSIAAAEVPLALQAAAARYLKGVTAEGDTVLHVVATHGDSADFMEYANFILSMDRGLLCAVNKRLDTPLHGASRAGRSRMISHLIKLAGKCNRLHEFLRMENELKETALHDAVRIGNKDIVERLLKADRDLAFYPLEGTSPLYLAILLGKDEIARTIHHEGKKLSYSGPNKRNALHAATFQGTGITRNVLDWNKGLAMRRDGDGSTPILIASSFFHWSGFKQLFEANPLQVYQADNNGLFPIHVAASVGSKAVVDMILEKFPSCAGLRTSQGQTFLHVAAKNKAYRVVSSVCETPSLDWILNMQDNDGDTALHLAVRASSLRIFGALYANNEVHLSLANNEKKTPLDISRSLLPCGIHLNWNSDDRIHVALRTAGAKHSNLRCDQTEEKYRTRLDEEETKKLEEKLKDSSQVLGIGSVLITTVAFGSTFALPGGFIADERPNRGTPILAGRYTFDAFMMANALAFICSTMATIGLMFSGSSLVSLRSRQFNLGTSAFFISSSLTCLSTAFALGVYMALDPVAHSTGIAICVLTPLIVVYRSVEFFAKLYILSRPLYCRLGPGRAVKWILATASLRVLMELWPFILIFSWAKIAWKIRNH